jgi:hypothetical protein
VKRNNGRLLANDRECRPAHPNTEFKEDKTMTKLTMNARTMFVMAAIAISTSAAASAQYKFVNISVPGSTWTMASGINNNNEIAGSYGTASGTYGFTYNPGNNSWHYPITDPKGSGYTHANSINIAGTVVGYYWTPPGRNVGMIDQPAGTFNDVLPAGCTENVVVTGINDQGTLSGYCQTTNSEEQLQTVAWSGYPTNVVFSCYDSTDTQAWAVNNLLLTVGSFTSSDGMTSSGFIATDQGTCTVVNYPDAAYTVLSGINDKGIITGSYWPSASGAAHGFVLTGSTFASVDVPGSVETGLGQVNNNGWLVGSYFDHKKVSHTFYAIPTTGASRLVDAEK